MDLRGVAARTVREEAAGSGLVVRWGMGGRALLRILDAAQVRIADAADDSGLLHVPADSPRRFASLVSASPASTRTRCTGSAVRPTIARRELSVR